MALFEGANFEPDEAKNVAIAALRRGFSTKYGSKFALQKVLINYDRALIIDTLVPFLVGVAQLVLISDHQNGIVRWQISLNQSIAPAGWSPLKI